MENEIKYRKGGMAIVGRKVSFAEADEIDNEYWRNASVAERFQTLIDLNYMMFGKKLGRIAKVVKRRHISDEEAD